jgi:hypothetical protein
MRLISRVELARLAGVSKAAVSKACGKQLAAACHRDRVDLDHDAVKAYLAKARPTAKASAGAPSPSVENVDTARAPTKKRKAAPPEPRAPTPRRPPPPKPAAPAPRRRRKTDEEEGHGEPPEGIEARSDEDLEQLAELLLPLTQRYGTVRHFKDWLEALRDIELIRKHRLANREAEGKLISRDLVKTHVFGAFESAFKRLLGDSTKTIARRVYALRDAGQPVEEAVRLVEELISKQLAPLKETAIRNLRRPANAQTKELRDGGGAAGDS